MLGIEGLNWTFLVKSCFPGEGRLAGLLFRLVRLGATLLGGQLLAANESFDRLKHIVLILWLADILGPGA